MTYLDPRDNRDIIEKIRRRYLLKSAACVLIFLGEALFFWFVRWEDFTEKFGAGNGAAVFILLAAVPFFLLGLHRDLADRSWEGLILSAQRRIGHKREPLTAVDKGDGLIDYTHLIIRMSDGMRKTITAPMDDIVLFRKGDRIRHIRGTKFYQLYRPGRNRTDCVMCGTAAEHPAAVCPECGFSLVKFVPQEEEVI